ncbi:hypothetical protein REPUB_Repub13aG0053100 [Reevesia pubescens]
MMRREVAEQIGNRLGTFMESDLGDESGGWGRFLRFKVSIDVGKPMIRGVWVTDGLTKEKYFTKLKYERLPNLCFWCGCLGHVDKDCESKDADVNSSRKPYGDWMKVSPLPTRSNRKGGFGTSPKEPWKNKPTKGVGTCESNKGGSSSKSSGSGSRSQQFGQVARKLNLEQQKIESPGKENAFKKRVLIDREEAPKMQSATEPFSGKTIGGEETRIRSMGAGNRGRGNEKQKPKALSWSTMILLL